MASPPAKTREISAITPRRKFEGHTDWVKGVVLLPGGQRIITCSNDGSLRVWNLERHTDWVKGVVLLPDGQRIITCSNDGSLRVWNLESRKQIGEDWKDSEVRIIALSPDGKKVVSGSLDGIVRLWDIDTCKVITKWMGHTRDVTSVCWSRDGRRVLSGSSDGTARQWDVESGETILKPIVTGHIDAVYAVVYSPDMTLFATGGCSCTCLGSRERDFSIKIRDAKTGQLVAALKGHRWDVTCLVWTKDGKTLISGSQDHSIRIWDTAKWEQTAVLDEHTNVVIAIAISPNGRILASASYDNTARLWNLNSGQPISPPLQHTRPVGCVSFAADGKLLATGCYDKNAYSWDVTVLVKEASLDDLLSDPRPKKSAFRATRPPIQICPAASRFPQGFFDGVPPAHSTARSCPHPPGSTFLSRLFHRSPSALPSSPLDWAQNILQRRRQSGKCINLQEHNPVVVEVPYAKGKRRNACAREQRKQIKSPLKNSTAGSSQSTKPNVTQPSSHPQAAEPSSSATPAAGHATVATTSTPLSRPHAMIRHPGVWTRFWLFIGCISPEYMVGDQ